MPVCLVTCCGSGPAVAVIKALRLARLSGPLTVVGSDVNPMNVGRCLVDRFERTPRADAPDFAQHMLDLCARLRVDYVFPILDLELEVWAKLRPAIAPLCTQ